MTTKTKFVQTGDFESVPIASVDSARLIAGVSFVDYCQDAQRVMREALADGLRGEAYTHYFTTKGRYNGKTETRYKPLNNLDLYEYAKRKYHKGG